MSSNVKVAVAQINCSVGDFEGNSRKIVDAAARAVAEGAHAMVTPELSLTGYPPEDLLLRRAFYAACDSALQRLAVQLLQFPDLAVVVGHPLAREGLRFNAAIKSSRDVKIPHRVTTKTSGEREKIFVAT